MLERYQGRWIRLTAEDGTVLEGTAEVFPSGYGLQELGWGEESLQLGETLLFRSQIRSIRTAEEAAPPAVDREGLMARLLEGPFLLADHLPRPVPREAGGRVFALERYFSRPDGAGALRRRFAELLLRLNCYWSMEVSFDACAHWTRDPEPEDFLRRTEALAGEDFLRVLYPGPGAMADLEAGELSLTLYAPDETFAETARALAGAAGLFLRPGEDAEI